MDADFLQGSRLIIELIDGEVFQGDFVEKYKDSIEIENILCETTKSLLNCVQRYYKNEIKKIYTLEEKHNSLISNNSDLVVKEDTKNNIVLSREDYDNLTKVSENYIYIKRDDKAYYDAVKTLINCEYVGVFAIGCEEGRKHKISLLALSSWRRVYIFDVKTIRKGEILYEIQEILESEYITKVVHCGGPLVDCLKYKHGIILENVFDTLVADLILTKNIEGKCPKKLRNISEVLQKRLNFPATLLQTSIKSLENDCWSTRPLEDTLLLRFSRLTTYLITLKDHLNRAMLKDFYDSVTSVHNLYTKASSYNSLRRSLGDNCDEDIESLIPDSILPVKKTMTNGNGAFNNLSESSEEPAEEP